MISSAVTLIGESAAFAKARGCIRRIARTNATALIEGETGTGKELVARFLHYEGPRRSGPFIPINCGTIPEALVESELFGHRQGAFTDAKSDAPGILLLADGGTLFLDEVDSLSVRAQVALLRFLQDRTIRPLGGGAERTVDVRIISATNCSLAALVPQRQFRQDLYYRLNVMHVELPPLRERGADIDLFAEHFLQQLGRRHGTAPPRLDERSLAWLHAHTWPGNIRELENLLEREFLLADGAPVLLLSVLQESAVVRDEESSWNYRRAKARVVEEFDRGFLERLMRHAEGNVTVAARTSGKERRDLGRLLRKYSIAPETFRSDDRY
jgi:two-component system response regulator GlrR